MRGFPLLIFTGLLAGCGRDEVRTYQVPKEVVSAVPTQREESKPISSPTGGPGFTAELPEDWTEKPGSGMRVASYGIAGTSIDFYLVSLAMGDLPSNVNRWRGQVGLPPASPERIAAETEMFLVDGHAANYIEIYNESVGKGIISAIVDLGPTHWYFTAKGSEEELKAHAADIRKFIETLKIQ